MIIIIILIFILPQINFPQDNSLIKNNLHSNQNIKKFADYLYCSEEYLRAALEYEKLFDNDFNDTLEFKTGLAYLKSGNFKEAVNSFKRVKDNSAFYPDSKREYFKSLFLIGDYVNYLDVFSSSGEINNSSLKLFNYSYLFIDERLPAKNDFLFPFDKDEKTIAADFYERKKDPPYKSPVAAAIMSAVIPGSGKIYAGKTGDGILAAVSTLLLGYLAYDNFQADHKVKGYIFSGLALFFYAGNIYGSAASAELYNAGIKFNFENEVKLYLQKQNYFSTVYDFCK